MLPAVSFAARGLAGGRSPLQREALLWFKGTMSPDPSSLYERIGGEEMIASLIPAFYAKVLKDPRLAPMFRDVSLEKLHTMQREFFTMATGGPARYTGRPLAHAHHGLGITPDQFNRFTGHLLETLLTLGVTQEEADEVVDRINVMANEITGTSY